MDLNENFSKNVLFNAWQNHEISITKKKKCTICLNNIHINIFLLWLNKKKNALLNFNLKANGLQPVKKKVDERPWITRNLLEYKQESIFFLFPYIYLHRLSLGFLSVYRIGVHLNRLPAILVWKRDPARILTIYTATANFKTEAPKKTVFSQSTISSPRINGKYLKIRTFYKRTCVCINAISTLSWDQPSKAVLNSLFLMQFQMSPLVWKRIKQTEYFWIQENWIT